MAKAHKVDDCEICGKYTNLSWHHVYGQNKASKRFSEANNAVLWVCWPCHVTNTDSIHNNAYLRKQLKAEHQERIMIEKNWTIQDWFKYAPMRKNYT